TRSPEPKERPTIWEVNAFYHALRDLARNEERIIKNKYARNGNLAKICLIHHNVWNKNLKHFDFTAKSNRNIAKVIIELHKTNNGEFLTKNLVDALTDGSDYSKLLAKSISKNSIQKRALILLAEIGVKDKILLEKIKHNTENLSDIL